ncbi:MAG: hypothetical protein ABI780_12340, partial [Ardenticatenales bacterium]
MRHPIAGGRSGIACSEIEDGRGTEREADDGEIGDQRVLAAAAHRSAPLARADDRLDVPPVLVVVLDRVATQVPDERLVP